MPCNIHNTVVPEDDWQVGRQGRQSGTGGGQGLVAGRVAWLTGSGGRQGRWLAGSGGWQGLVVGRVVGREWIFCVENFLE